MAEESFSVLFVSEPERTGAAAPWSEHGRFELTHSTPARVSCWLERRTADALVWRAGKFDDNLAKAVESWKSLRPQMQILVLLEGLPEPRGLVALMHAGCYDVLDGTSPEQLRAGAEALCERIEFVRTRGLERLRVKQSMEYAGLVGESPEMLRVYEQLRHAAGLSSPVLIEGETGTGKGLAAHAIHALGPRDGKPFVTVDCGCLAPTLIESELYGATRGAFTGATSDRVGLVQTARNGTLFLDEIGELPLEMQPKLLRLLEEGEVRQLGSARSTPINVRVISATSRNLDALIANRRFRVELYYRLNVLHIVLPPLRERPQDIPLLAAHFASRHLFRGEPVTVAETALDVLRQYFWPGNVRELKNYIEAAIPTLTRNSIYVQNLPRRLTEAVAAASPGRQAETLNLKALEERAIRQALLQSGNHKSRAAKLLGIGKTTLYRKLKQITDRAGTEPERSPDQPFLM